MYTNSRIRMLQLGLAGMLMSVAGPAVLAQSGDAEVTWARDVAPIFQAKCQVCHQPNSVAPLSLLTYREVVEEARSIKANVEARVMPPWHIDRSTGITEFKNDQGLTDAEIETAITLFETSGARDLVLRDLRLHRDQMGAVPALAAHPQLLGLLDAIAGWFLDPIQDILDGDG